MNERVFYVPIMALLHVGYLRTVTSEGMKGRMQVLSDVMLVGCDPGTSQR